MFNVSKVTNDCIQWIKDWFSKNGPNCNCIIGISGGKDSSIAACLCALALGKERVIGVMLPQNNQIDIEDSKKLINHLGIKSYEFNIGCIANEIFSVIGKDLLLTKQALTNLPARIRMSFLYAISQSLNGRVCNTCNYSEDYVGYSTKYGDSAGDFSPLCKLTVTELLEIGTFLKLPRELVFKTPLDGLSGKTDEENLGFKYETLDLYIRHNIIPEKRVKDLIDKLHKNNLFKLLPMEYFPYEPV